MQSELAFSTAVDSKAARLMEKVSLVLCIAALVGSVFTLTGWICGIEILTSPSSLQSQIKTNASINFLLLSAALLLRKLKLRHGWPRYASAALAWAAILIAGLTLAEYAFNINLGIDEFVHKDVHNPVGTHYPNRMAASGAIGFIILGICILLHDFKTSNGHVPNQWISVLIFAVASIYFIEYTYNIGFPMLSDKLTHIAFYALCLFLMLAASIAFSRPGEGFLGKISGDAPRDAFIRRALLIMLGIIFIPSWLALELLNMRLISHNNAIALLIMLNITSFAVLLLYIFKIESMASHAKSTLGDTEQRQAALLNNIPDMAWLKDKEGRFIMVNKPFAAACGRKPEDLIGKTDLDIWPKELADKYRADDAEVMKNRERKRVTEPLVDKNGVRTIVETIKTPIRDADDNIIGTAGITRDITEQKRTEEQLLQSQKMEAVGQLAGGVAHDFNNLLMAINGYSDFALVSLPKNSPARQDIEEIRNAGERAAALTRQLLAFSRKQVLQPQVMNLNSSINNMLKMLRRLIKENIDLEIKLEPTLDNIMADPGQMEQIILNLVVNANDALPDGGRISVATSRAPEARVMLEVTDNGTGIDEETISHIFEPFFTTKERGKGTGLGLSTVYGIVEQSGGQISVKSERAQGTCFTICFPAVGARESSDETDKTREQAAGGGETILLVEDDERVRTIIGKILKNNGYKVISASNGREALDACDKQGNRVNLLITDMIMPHMTGRTLAEHAKVIYPSIKVLIISGYTDDLLLQNGLTGKHYAFMNKPFTSKALAKKVQELLDAPPQA